MLIGSEGEALRLIDKALTNIETFESKTKKPKTNKKALKMFLDSKEIEGCSHRSLAFYSYTVSKFFTFNSSKLEQP